MNAETMKNKLVHHGRLFSEVSAEYYRIMAERAGLSGPDFKYLDILIREGKMTAGRLSRLSGRSTGSVTAIIDRLEKAGLVKREFMAEDRRKVLVTPNEETIQKRISAYFDLSGKQLDEITSEYSERELELILEYLETCTRFYRDKINELGQKAGE